MELCELSSSAACSGLTSARGRCSTAFLLDGSAVHSHTRTTPPSSTAISSQASAHVPSISSAHCTTPEVTCASTYCTTLAVMCAATPCTTPESHVRISCHVRTGVVYSASKLDDESLQETGKTAGTLLGTQGSGSKVEDRLRDREEGGRVSPLGRGLPRRGKPPHGDDAFPLPCRCRACAVRRERDRTRRFLCTPRL